MNIEGDEWFGLILVIAIILWIVISHLRAVKSTDEWDKKHNIEKIYGLGKYKKKKFIPSPTNNSNDYPSDWDRIRTQVLSRDNYKCGNCGSSHNLHVHHIVPLSKGGTNNLSNLKTLCEDCHKSLHPHMK